MRILALGAHADDVELGCGGALLRWASHGHAVHIHVATDSAYTAPDGREVRAAAGATAEAHRAAERIGATLSFGPFKSFEMTFSEPLNAHLITVLDRVQPDLIVTHWAGDTHPDHQAVARATLHAGRRVPSILAYASNWYPGAEAYDPRLFIDISDTLDAKLELIAIYAGEDARTGGAWRDWSRERAAILGRVIGVRYAEAFVPIRMIGP